MAEGVTRELSPLFPRDIVKGLEESLTSSLSFSCFTSFPKALILGSASTMMQSEDLQQSQED